MFYGIGTGVGNSGGLTIKAVEILQKLDILYVPLAKKSGASSVAHQIVKDYINEKTVIKERHFPMNYDSIELRNAWESIAREIEDDVNDKKEVGFVTIGDPMVYSTYVYLLKILRKKINIQTIPGVTSFQDIAANHNFPLVEGDDPLIVLPATADRDKLINYIKNENSLVLMKVYKNFRDILNIIVENKLEDCTIAVSNSSKEGEQVFLDIRDMKQEDVSYFTTIIINKRWRNK